MLSKWSQNILSPSLSPIIPVDQKPGKKLYKDVLVNFKNHFKKNLLLGSIGLSCGTHPQNQLGVEQIPPAFKEACIVPTFQRSQLWKFRYSNMPRQMQPHQLEPLQQHNKDSTNHAWPSLIQAVLILNGSYDIVCGCCILWFSAVPWLSLLASLHPTMFREEGDQNHPVIRRILSYWLITYGSARMAAGLHKNTILSMFGALTYFIEAVCFEYEHRVGGTMVPFKVTCVSALCLALGCLVLSRTVHAIRRDAWSRVIPNLALFFPRPDIPNLSYRRVTAPFLPRCTLSPRPSSQQYRRSLLPWTERPAGRPTPGCRQS